jgi:hypothetical protein
VTVGLQFSDSVSIGNVLTIAAMLGGGLAAFFDLKGRSRTNILLIEQLRQRLDNCKLEQIQERVDTMWAFQLRRGLREVAQKGLGKINSPITLTREAESLMQPLVPELKQFYKIIHGEELGLVDLAIKLEQQFGHRLSEEVCTKASISDAACLVLAIAMLRPIGPGMIKTATEQCGDEHQWKDILAKSKPTVG